MKCTLWQIKFDQTFQRTRNNNSEKPIIPERCFSNLNSKAWLHCRPRNTHVSNDDNADMCDKKILFLLSVRAAYMRLIVSVS